MRNIFFFARALLVCSAFAPVCRQCAAQEKLPELHYYRQQAFGLPFTVDKTTSPETQPAEVRLYVSADRGAKWNLAQTKPPVNDKFEFQAPGDGEYWFEIRTVDRAGRIVPEVGGRPDMRVYIDTVPPRLELSAVRGESGEVKAKWLAVDPLLNGNSLKIEYLTSTGGWQPVAIDRTRTGNDPITSKGEVTWWPTDVPPGDVRIRAEVSDRALNVTKYQEKATASRAPVGREDYTAQVVTPQPQSSSYPNTPFNSANMQEVAAAQRNPADAKTNAKNVAARNNAGDTGRSTPWPADQSAGSSLGRNPIPNVGSSDQFTASPGSQSGGAPMLDWQTPPAGNDTSRPFGGEFSTANNSGSSPGREGINPPIRNQVSPKNKDRNTEKNGNGLGNRETSTPQNDPTLPAGERPRMVNSKSFEMDYEVDSVGPSGIAKVQLWVTRDGGQNWREFGSDDDNRSPIRVTTDGEGLYGFRMVVKSGNGLAGRPPRNGDTPEVWVGVDLTKPAVRFTGIQIGEGAHAGELLIQWQASDKYLANRPITLSFSEKPSGPWSIIAAGLDNNGQYAWRPDSRVPQRIFLRIEARDEAGNTAVFDATEPVSLEQVQPEGKIRGVRPVNDSMSSRTPKATWR